ncbi:MAG: MgtC/SapB family protein [Candidatus Korobacteraceae bacterium]
MEIYRSLPPEAVKILLVLFLSFLIGLEREEHKVGAAKYSFGGVRTFPLIGLIGYLAALLSGPELVPLTVGFLIIAAFLWLSYWHKLSTSGTAGVTSEMSGLATYLIAALVYEGHFWIATSLTVASLLLLELKTILEDWATRVPADEILTFAKFLLLSAVILPVLPNREFGFFRINPFKTWLVVVAVSAISYGSYVLQKLTKNRGGLLLTSVLGGAYSSTVTTVALARRAAREEHPYLYSGGILIASGVMYFRLIVLLWLFNRQLMVLLAPEFIALASVAILAGWLWSKRSDPAANVKRDFEPRNPLELRVAFLFALVFLAMLVGTHLALSYLGRAGVNTFAAIMGVTDVDPFILGITQSAGTLTPLRIGASAIVIAAASNNLMKGIYAYALARRRTGVQSFCLLAGLAAIGLLPLFWL